MADLVDLTRKIRALLHKAENTSYPPEAEAATRKATELMARHRITEAMLAADPSPTRMPPRVTTRTIAVSRGPYVAARTALLAGIAGAFGVRMVYATTWEGRRCELLGIEADLEAVDLLYTSLLLQASVAAAHETVPRGQTAVAWRRGFLLGFADTVSRRLDEIMRDAMREAESATTSSPESSSSSVALVLADREARINEEYTRRYGRVASGRRPRPVLANAHARGTDAGHRADLGRRAPVEGSRGRVGPGDR